MDRQPAGAGSTERRGHAVAWTERLRDGERLVELLRGEIELLRRRKRERDRASHPPARRPPLARWRSRPDSPGSFRKLLYAG
jgi:hypothetical protein